MICIHLPISVLRFRKDRTTLIFLAVPPCEYCCAVQLRVNLFGVVHLFCPYLLHTHVIISKLAPKLNTLNTFINKIKLLPILIVGTGYFKVVIFVRTGVCLKSIVSFAINYSFCLNVIKKVVFTFYPCELYIINV